MSEMRRFTFFPSYFEAVEELEDESLKAKCYAAIIRYGVTGEEPTEKGVVSTVFKLVKPNIDTSIKRANAGAKGGSAEASTDQAEAKRKQTASKTEAKCENPASDKEKDKEKEKEKGIRSTEKEKETEVDIKTISGTPSDEVAPLTADVAGIPLADSSEWRPTVDLYNEYRLSYPGVDLDMEFRKMRSWCLSNPKNLKTKQGVTRFVNTWLNKAQNEASRLPKRSGYVEAINNRFDPIQAFMEGAS